MNIKELLSREVREWWIDKDVDRPNRKVVYVFDNLNSVTCPAYAVVEAGYVLELKSALAKMDEALGVAVLRLKVIEAEAPGSTPSWIAEEAKLGLVLINQILEPEGKR